MEEREGPAPSRAQTLQQRAAAIRAAVIEEHAEFADGEYSLASGDDDGSDGQAAPTPDAALGSFMDVEVNDTEKWEDARRCFRSVVHRTMEGELDDPCKKVRESREPIGDWLAGPVPKSMPAGYGKRGGYRPEMKWDESEMNYDAPICASPGCLLFAYSKTGYCCESCSCIHQRMIPPGGKPHSADCKHRLVPYRAYDEEYQAAMKVGSRKDNKECVEHPPAPPPPPQPAKPPVTDKERERIQELRQVEAESKRWLTETPQESLPIWETAMYKQGWGSFARRHSVGRSAKTFGYPTPESWKPPSFSSSAGGPAASATRKRPPIPISGMPLPGG